MEICPDQKTFFHACMYDGVNMPNIRFSPVRDLAKTCTFLLLLVLSPPPSLPPPSWKRRRTHPIFTAHFLPLSIVPTTPRALLVSDCLSPTRFSVRDFFLKKGGIFNLVIRVCEPLLSLLRSPGTHHTGVSIFYRLVSAAGLKNAIYGEEEALQAATYACVKP